MMQRILAAVILSAAPVLGQTVSYEATSVFPEDDGWTLLPTSFPAEQWLEDGWLVQESELVQQGQELEGEKRSYRRDLDDMAGASPWFLQWRVVADSPPFYLNVSPVAVAAGGNSGVLYHFVIGDSEMRFLRDVAIPPVFADIEAGMPHTYRLELVPNSYAFYIDGTLIDAGIPEGAYPTSDSFVVFSGKTSDEITLMRWDYVRYAILPSDYSGDYDSNGVVDSDDAYFFVDCLLGPGASWPGCTWADMNADGTADGKDIPLFVEAMLNS